VIRRFSTCFGHRYAHRQENKFFFKTACCVCLVVLAVLVWSWDVSSEHTVFTAYVSIIPPLLHTHSYIYHPRCIMSFSLYFSFPCQYHSTIAPYSFIHLPPTLYNVFLPVLQSPLSVSFHHCSILIHSSTTHAV